MKKLMLIFKADQDSETDYGLKWYYNTESRGGPKKIQTCEKEVFFNVEKP